MLADRWNAYWFEPAPASDLGLCRMSFFAGLFLIYLPEDFSGWGSVSDAFWMPIWVFERAGIPRLDEASLSALQWCWKASLLLSAIGLFTRASVLVAFATGSYLLALPHNFGHTYHFDALLVFVMGVLALSHAGHSWSIDALLRRRAEEGPSHSPPVSGEYRWPIRLVWVLMALVFLGAGLSKLRHAGMEWVASDTMRTFLIRAQYGVSDADPLVTWGLTLSQVSWAPRILAAGALVVELFFVLALFSARARLLFVPAAFVLLVAIRALMGPTFGGFLVAMVFWVPWTAVLGRVGARLPVRKDLRGPAHVRLPRTASLSVRGAEEHQRGSV